ncbi:MAG TPA: TraB/GumN family protein [Stellaceae bacterium]|nr:TraB/GumN family protein [Stellaceae bacterium]
MIRRIALTARALAAAAVLAGFALLSLAAPSSAEPALWVAKGSHATVYLFGTIHLLKPHQAWGSPAIEKALMASQELWLEVPDPDDQAEAQKLAAQLGYDPQHPLSTKLAPPDLARLDAAAKSLGIAQGEKVFEPMRPWFVSVALEGAIVAHAGYDPDRGVEQQLLHDESLVNKPVHGFETFAQQMHFFSNMSTPLEVDLLRNTLQDFSKGASQLDAVVDAWQKGDDAGIARIMVDEVKQPFPQLYRTILVNRNLAWAGVIAKMLQGSGVTFIAVGAAHLAGPDSVQAALERQGITVERVRAD